MIKGLRNGSSRASYLILDPDDHQYIGACVIEETSIGDRYWFYSMPEFFQHYGSRLSPDDHFSISHAVNSHVRNINGSELRAWWMKFPSTMLKDFEGRTDGDDKYTMGTAMFRDLIYYIQDKVGEVVEKVKEKFKEPDYQPYQDGSIVHRLFVSNSTEIDTRSGVGKILSLLKKRASTGDYIYEVEFLKSGVDHVAHSKLVPARDFFDHMITGKDCYLSEFKCGGLFDVGAPFLLRDGYLYNKGNSVILKFVKFQNKFRKNDTVQQPASKTEEV